MNFRGVCDTSHAAMQHKEFASLSIFKKWKEEEESLTYTSFAQPKGEALCSGGYHYILQLLVLFLQIGTLAPSSMFVVEMVSPEKTSNLGKH